MYFGFEQHGLPKSGHELDSPKHETKSIDSLLSEVGDYINGDIYGPYTERYVDLENLPPMPKSLREAYGKFIKVFGTSVKDKIEQDFVEEEVNNFIDEELKPIAQNGLVSRIPLAVLSVAEKEKYLADYYKEFIAITEPIIDADADTKLSAVKVLASNENQGNHIQSDRPIQAFQVLAFYGKLTNQPKNFVNKLIDDLDQGKLKGVIAKELVIEVLADDVDANGNNSSEIGKTIRMLCSLTGRTKNEIIAYLCSEKSYEFWPEKLIKAVDQQTSMYKTAIAVNTASAKEFLTERMISFDEYTDEKLNSSLDRLLYEFQKPTDKSIISPKTKGGVTAIISARRAKRQKAQGEVQQKETAETVELPAIEREVGFMDTNGVFHDPDSEEYKDFINSYASDHLEDHALKEDVNGMIAYIAKLDLKNGLPRGIKKQKQGCKRGDINFKKIYELKPSECVGLPTSSCIAEKTRIIFGFHEGKAVILGITDRDKFHQLEISLGIKGRARRG